MLSSKIAEILLIFKDYDIIIKYYMYYGEN